MAVLSKDLAKEFPYTDNCELLARQIELLTINKEYWSRQFNDSESNDTNKFLLAKKKWYEVYGCLSKISEIKSKDITSVVQNYTNIDKTRIDAKTTSDVLKKNIIGGSILILSLLMIIFLSKKSKKK